MKLTKAQSKAVLAKYRDNPDGFSSYLSFRRQVVPMAFITGPAVLPWCGMFLAVETDGYTHS